MATIPQQVLESFARIGYSEKPLMAWLEERLREYDRRNRFQPDDVQLRISQGRAQELSDILDMARTAPELLRKA